MGSYIEVCLMLLCAACASGETLGCPPMCSCPETLPCPPGAAAVLDSCGCGCTVCVQDLGAECDGFRPCDAKQDLICNFQENSIKRQGVCKARHERQSSFDNSNETLHVRDVYPAPSDASVEGMIRSRREDSDDREQDEEPPEDASTCRQDTEWTPCSRTCGFGNSLRIVYDKESCIPRAEKRLCMTRPCKGQYPSANYTVLKASNVCSRVMRWSHPLHLRFRDCLSSRPLLPKFCGVCSDGRLCTPSLSETRPVSFQCAQLNRKVTRQVTWVQNCQCGGKRGKKGKTGKNTTKPEGEMTNELVEEV